MTDQPTVHELHVELDHLLAELVEPRVRRVLRDDMTTTTHTMPPLLVQLRQALAHGGETGKASRSRVGEPIRLRAADMVRQLEREAAELHYNAMVADADAAARLRATAAIASRWTDVDRVAIVVGALRRWVTAIRNLVDPQRHLHVAAPCPTCDETVVWREDPAGGSDPVQTPALQVDGHHGARCLACGHSWPTADLEDLAEQLEVAHARGPRRRLRSGATGNGGWSTTQHPHDDGTELEEAR